MQNSVVTVGLFLKETAGLGVEVDEGFPRHQSGIMLLELHIDPADIWSIIINAALTCGLLVMAASAITTIEVLGLIGHVDLLAA